MIKSVKIMEIIKYDLPKTSLKEKVYNTILNSGLDWKNTDNEKIVDEVNVSMLTDKIIEILNKSICNHHNVSGLNYLQYYDWAHKKIDNGEFQSQCLKCGLFLFKDEF